MKDFSYAVYIGRFQPFHNGHLEVVKHGLEIAERVIIVVGSVNAAPSIKNPWSFEERRDMIAGSLGRNVVTYEAEHTYSTDRVAIVGVRDYHYNENSWVAEVQAKTDQFIRPGETVALLGEWKDASSYYLKHFPQWEFVPISQEAKISMRKYGAVEATAIRERLLRENFMKDWEGKVPESKRPEIDRIIERLPVPDPVCQFLYGWTKTPEYINLTREWAFMNDYKNAWANSPYPPTFVTVDAVVVCSGHVLVVKRKLNPGKGLYALPGGFIRQDERLQRAMLRELKEETGIRVDPLILESSIVATKAFDHPSRSLRGRTITHGFYLKLKDGQLPEVRGGDDAAEALWIPLIDVAKNERLFFDDHAHIIHHFLNYS